MCGMLKGGNLGLVRARFLLKLSLGNGICRARLAGEPLRFSPGLMTPTDMNSESSWIASSRL